MSTCNEVINKIIGWLRQGIEQPRKLVDFPWEVEEISETLYRAIHPMFPVSIYIGCDEELGTIRIQTPLEVETLTLSNEEKLLLYHKLLKLSSAPLVKYILVGDEDIPTVAVDLSIRSLGKNEFNDALAIHLATVNAIIKELGLTSIYETKLYQELLLLVKKHLEEGWGREKLLDYLVKYARLKPEQAREIIDSLLSGGEASNIYA